MEPPKHHIKMEAPQQQELYFISWNTAGVKFTKDKRPKFPLVLEELNKHNPDVAFLQETHIGPQTSNPLENVKGWKSYFTVHNSRSKGVAILIKNKTFNYICHDEDYSGGYIVLFCQLYGQLYTLVNVYNHKKDRDMLHRLKDYLTDIKTKGVLIVGGDFNTVLDPTFDRKSLSDHSYISSLRNIVEDFTNSLNLLDVFADIHQTDEGFTRSQNESHSRLDMFFMTTDTINDVKNCENVKATAICCKTGEKRISDHDPLLLRIKVRSPPDYKMPEVASMLRDFKHSCKSESIETCKINGAEILNSIRSLPDSQRQRPDKLSISAYKDNDLPMTEILKINYNIMLKTKYVPECFTASLLDVQSKENYFNVDYLIFTQILAKRLKVFVTSAFKKKEKRKKVAHGVRLYVTLPKDQDQKIKMKYLKKNLGTHSTPPKDFTILESLLPTASHSQNKNDYRKLLKGCPLTRPILTLVLKQLESEIIKTNYSQYTTITSVCHFRLSLLICTDNQKFDRVLKLLDKFPKDSGIKINYKKPALPKRTESPKNTNVTT